jgi:hypothetical protein
MLLNTVDPSELIMQGNGIGACPAIDRASINGEIGANNEIVIAPTPIQRIRSTGDAIDDAIERIRTLRADENIVACRQVVIRHKLPLLIAPRRNGPIGFTI